jgi:hypothetical protein
MSPFPPCEKFAALEFILYTVRVARAHERVAGLSGTGFSL